MSQISKEPLVYTVSEVSKLLRLSRGATYEAIRKRQIPSIHIGRRILIPRVALERQLQDSSRGSNEI